MASLSCFSDVHYRRLDTSTAENQHFSLPLDQMKCIRENASPDVLHKLYQCCKWFPMRCAAVICNFLEMEGQSDGFQDVEMDEHDLRLNTYSRRDLSHLKIFVRHRLMLRWSPINYLTKIMPLIYSCTAKTVEIYNQELRWSDILPLIQHGNVTKLCLAVPLGCQVKEQTTPDFFVEDLIAFTPDIVYLDLYGIPCTKETLKKLVKMQFSNKFEVFHIGGNVSAVFDPNEFADFLCSHCNASAAVSWSYRMSMQANKNTEEVKIAGQRFLA